MDGDSSGTAYPHTFRFKSASISPADSRCVLFSIWKFHEIFLKLSMRRPRGKQDNEMRFGILPQTGMTLPNWRVKFGVPPVACFPPESGGQVRTCPYRKTWDCRSWFRQILQLNFFTSTAVSNIYPLLGAMGLVLTRLSRSSDTLKRCFVDGAVNVSRGCSLPFVGR